MVEFREKNSATSKGLLVREVGKNTIQRFRYFCYEMMEITKITNSENDWNDHWTFTRQKYMSFLIAGFPFYTIGRFLNTPCIGSNHLLGTCVLNGECRSSGGISTGSCSPTAKQAVCCVCKFVQHWKRRDWIIFMKISINRFRSTILWYNGQWK